MGSVGPAHATLESPSRVIVATSRNLPAPVHAVLSRVQRSLPTTQLHLRGLDAVDLEPLFDDGASAAERAGEGPAPVTSARRVSRDIRG